MLLPLPVGAHAPPLPSSPPPQCTQHFNECANFVSSAIVGVRHVTQRAALMGHFIGVAAELRRLHNYSGVNAILAGLGSAAVHRLKHTQVLLPPPIPPPPPLPPPPPHTLTLACPAPRAYAPPLLGVLTPLPAALTQAKLGKKTLAEWEALRELMSHKCRYKEYRADVCRQQAAPPFIPYLGIHLSDLTFLGDGNPDEVDGLLNFSKRQHAAQVLLPPPLPHPTLEVPLHVHPSLPRRSSRSASRGAPRATASARFRAWRTWWTRRRGAPRTTRTSCR